MGAKEEAKDLIAQRDKLDAEIEQNFEILKKNDSTMDSPLVDKEGFPFSHIDVYGVRQARHKIICLRNDRKALTEKIEKAIQKSHAEEREIKKSESGTSCGESDEVVSSESKDDGAEKENQTNKQPEAPVIVHRTSNKPFIKVTTVIPNSPAAEGGLRADDLIIQYGQLHADNFRDMKEVSVTTAKHEGQKLRVTVLRNYRAARLEIYPRRWSGSGILGCGIVPISTSDII